MDRRAGRWPAPVVGRPADRGADPTGTSGFLLPALDQGRVTVEPVARRFYVEACSALDAAVSARSVRHGKQPGLNDTVAVARWSTSGVAGQRVLSRKDPRCRRSWPPR